MSFKRSSRRNTADDVGKVRVQIVLVAAKPGTQGVHAVKGNITRTITLKNATVGDVAAEIEKILLPA